MKQSPTTRRTPAIIMCALAVMLSLSSGAWGNTILQNGIISAEFDSKALVRITDTATGLNMGFTGVSSSITVDSTTLNTATLTPSNTNVGSDSITYTYVVGARQLQVVYELKSGWRFVCMRMFLTIPSGVTSRVNSVVSFTGNVTNAIYSVVKGLDHQAEFTGTTFVRFSNGSAENGYGMFALVQNPYVTWSRTGQSITMSYTPDMNWKSTYGAFPTDRCCIGPYALSGNRFPAHMVDEYLYVAVDPARNGVDWSEVDAVRQCMKAFLTFNTDKCTRIHILWCEGVHMDNDAATPEGRVAYKRAIDRAKEFGCDDLLYIATNNAVSTNSPAYNADSWQAEYCLWFSMGQQIRKGLWDPINGPIPISIQEILDHAASKNVKLSAYVYPSLPFQQNPEWINSSNVCDTGVRSFQDWYTNQLVGFANNTGAGGFCFDYWWVNLSGSDITSRYAQFFGCRRMLDITRQQLPDAIFDLRQEVCWFGPWFWLDGTYPHPLNDDEGAGSWRAFPDLHVDRCYAARHRYKWFWHVVDQYAPIELAPGFITHAGARTGSVLHPRDWDYMGWKYNMLSTVGTAPFNLVVNYIPVLDQTEYDAISQADKDWFNYWMDWAESHLDYMRNARPIISQVMIGKVDGSAAFINDHGYIFLYNPNYRKISGDFKLDSSIGLNTGTKFLIRQLEPQSGKLIGKPGTGLWNYGDTVSIPVPGTSAMVFEVLPVSSITEPTLLNMQGDAAMQGTQLQIMDATGEVGAFEDFIAAVPTGTVVNSVTVNGRQVNSTRNGDTIIGKVKFAGEKFGIDQQIGTYDAKFKSTIYRGSFKIPQRIINQLQNRRAALPVTFTTEDLYAAWTAPYRQLIFIHIADAWPSMAVSAKINGVAVTVKKGYNGSYEAAGNWMFQGYYIDASNLLPDTPYQIEITMPVMPFTSGDPNTNFPNAQFQGLFFENIETEYTQSISDSKLPSEPLVDLDASRLPLGALTTWTNSGLLAGSFGKDTTNPQVQFLAGKKCVTFGGSDRMKSTFLSPSTITTNGKYTVSIWAYNPAIASNECMLTWAHTGGAAGTNAQFNYGSSTSSGAVSHGSTLDMGFDGGLPNAGMWHHIAVTFDGSVEKVYVDGALNAQESKTLSMFTTDYFYLACAYTGSAPTSYFSGSIASVQVFDTAFGADDIAALAAGPVGMSIAEAAKQPENSIVTLTAKPVTCAPRNISNARTTTYFYTGEPNRVSGIRVQDGTTGQDSVTAGTRVTVTGTIKTLSTTGERYLELGAPAYNETGSAAKPVLVNTRSAQTDVNLMAQQVKVAGVVREISGDGKWFTIADGYYLGGAEVGTKILIEGNFATGSLHSGDRVVVTGVIGKEGTSPPTATRLVIAQDVR